MQNSSVERDFTMRLNLDVSIFYFYLQLFIKLLSQDAEAEDLKAQKKEMEDIVQPIIAKLYQVGYIASFIPFNQDFFCPLHSGFFFLLAVLN